MKTTTTTQKAIKANYQHIIAVSYCGLQTLLMCEQAEAYTTRAEGWEADIYGFGNAAIVTGYAPFGNVRPDYETNQRYEEKAMQAVEGFYDYLVKKEILKNLIEEYIQEVTQ